MTRDIVVVFVLGMVATYASRLSFVAFADRAGELPHAITTALKMIPPAALAALTVPSILKTSGQVDLLSPRVAAGLVAAVVAFRTKNPILTMTVGIGLLALLNQV